MSSYLTVLAGGSRAAKKTLSKTVRTTACGGRTRTTTLMRQKHGRVGDAGSGGPRSGGFSLLGASGLFGSLSIFGGGARAYAARTAGHAGGNVFKQGKLGGGGARGGVKRRGRGEPPCGPREVEGESNAPRRLPSRPPKRGKGGSSELTMASVLPLLLFAGVVGYGIYSASGDRALINLGGGDSEKGYSVAQVQIGLLGSARLVQRDLDKIADSADTSSRNGLYALMQDSVIALIRSPEYWVYGNTQGKRTNSQDRTETYFNQFEMRERSKFELETSSNVQGKKAKREWRRPERDWKTGGSYTDINELIVVTLIVACEQDLKLPKIESQEDMRIALQRLGSLRASSILAVELFWTPQDPDDVYTQEELITEYPEMKLI